MIAEGDRMIIARCSGSGAADGQRLEIFGYEERRYTETAGPN